MYYVQVEVLQEMDSSYFGEGLTLLGERFVTELHFGYPVDSGKIGLHWHCSHPSGIP